MRSALASSLAALSVFVACVGSDPDPATPPEVVYVEAGATSGSSGSTGTNGTSGGSISDAGKDADPSTFACDPGAPFGAAQLIPGTSLGMNQDSVTVTADELHLYLHVMPEDAVYLVERDTTAETFGASTKVGGLPGTPASPAVSPDDLTLVYTSKPNDSTALYFAHRDTPTGTFQPTPQDLVNNKPEIVRNPKATNDTIYANVETIGGGPPGLIRVNRNSSVALLQPVNVKGLDSDVAGFTVVDNGRRAYFETQRAGSDKGWNIWTVTRADDTQDWAAPTPVAGVNTPDDEYMGSISADGCRLYFTRVTGAASHVFMASRAKL